MRLRILLFATTYLLCSGARSANGVHAENTAPKLGPTPILNVMAGGVVPGGVGVRIGNVLLSDQTTRTYIAVGTSENPSPCALSGGAIMRDRDTVPAGALAIWQFEMRLKSSDRYGAVVALHWTRTVLDPAAVDADSIERTYDVSLSEGHSIPLDLLRPRHLPKVLDEAAIDPSKETCEGVAIELELTFQDQPQLENALLDYDIWLLQTDGSGKQRTERVLPRGFQGHELEYLFARQQYDVDGTQSPAGPVSIRLSGSVKGRIRADGKIDLAVILGRTVFVGSLGNGDGGHKQETVADGETIELRIPRIAADSLKGVPKNSSLYAGDTAIRVTVRRVS